MTEQCEKCHKIGIKLFWYIEPDKIKVLPNEPDDAPTIIRLEGGILHHILCEKCLRDNVPEQIADDIVRLQTENENYSIYIGDRGYNGKTLRLDGTTD